MARVAVGAGVPELQSCNWKTKGAESETKANLITEAAGGTATQRSGKRKNSKRNVLKKYIITTRLKCLGSRAKVMENELAAPSGAPSSGKKASGRVEK